MQLPDTSSDDNSDMTPPLPCSDPSVDSQSDTSPLISDTEPHIKSDPDEDPQENHADHPVHNEVAPPVTQAPVLLAIPASEPNPTRAEIRVPPAADFTMLVGSQTPLRVRNLPRLYHVYSDIARDIDILFTQNAKLCALVDCMTYEVGHRVDVIKAKWTSRIRAVEEITRRSGTFHNSCEA